ETAEAAQGFRPLYTGLDLSGWKAGEREQADWKPHDWVLECAGKTPLESEKEYGNFVLICDWAQGKDGSSPVPLVRLRGSDRGDFPLSGGAAEGGAEPGKWNRT